MLGSKGAAQGSGGGAALGKSERDDAVGFCGLVQEVYARYLDVLASVEAPYVLAPHEEQCVAEALASWGQEPAPMWDHDLPAEEAYPYPYPYPTPTPSPNPNPNPNPKSDTGFNPWIGYLESS